MGLAQDQHYEQRRRSCRFTSGKRGSCPRDEDTAKCNVAAAEKRSAQVHGRQLRRPNANDQAASPMDAADGPFYLNEITATGVDSVLARAEVSMATLDAPFGGF